MEKTKEKGRKKIERGFRMYKEKRRHRHSFVADDSFTGNESHRIVLSPCHMSSFLVLEHLA